MNTGTDKKYIEALQRLSDILTEEIRTERKTAYKIREEPTMNIDDQTKLDALRWRCLVRLATVEYHAYPSSDISLRLSVDTPGYPTPTDAVDYLLLSGATRVE